MSEANSTWSQSGGPGGVRRRPGPLVVCCAVLVVLAFWQEPGSIVADTKLDLTADPAGFLARAMHLWDPSAAFGQLQNQAYGYLFPMGPFHLVGDLLGQLAGLPAWVVQRTWWALIMVVAFLGVVRLATVIGIGTPWSRLLGGLSYALAPRILVSLGAVSIEAWPTALAPWVLIPVVLASRGGPVLRNAALSALAVFCIGGVNAAATAAAVVPAVLWLLLAPGWAGRVRFASWWFGCMALVTAWWWVPLLLLGEYAPPFLDWIETAATTTQHTSLVETFRGNNHWLSYLSGPAGPQWPAGWLLASEPLLILDTVVVAALGLAGLARLDMPARRVLLCGVLAGLVAICAGYVGAGGGLLAEQVRQLLDGPLAPLRNVHKFDVVVRLPLALGLAHLLGSVRAGALAGRHIRALPVRYARALAAGLAVVVFTGVATPALAGRLPQEGAYDAIPGYWHEAAAWLDANVDDGRALLVPGAPFAEYTWGAPRDEPVQALSDIRWAVRDSVPLSSAGNIRLLDAIEKRLAAGVGGAGVVEALGRAGVSHLVVRNDLDRQRTGAPRPVVVHEAIADLPGTSRVAAFGPDVGAGDDADRSTDSRLDVRYPAVEIYRVGPSDDPDHRVHVYPVEGSVRLSGGPESLLSAGDAGLLDDRAVFVAGDGADVEDAQPVPVVTDGLRRRAVWFGASRDNTTEVLAAGDDGDLGRAVRDYWVADPSRETVAVSDGVLVTASSSGADPRATLARGAEHSPWAALDGDPETSWVSGEYGEAVGQWLEVSFDQPRKIGPVELTMLDDAPVSASAQRVSVATDNGEVEAVVGETGTVVVPLSDGKTTSIRVTVLAVGPGSVSGAGITELRAPGLEVTRTLSVPPLPPQDLGGAVGDGDTAPAETVVLAVADGRRGECVTTASADTGKVDEVARCARPLSRAGEENSDLRRQIDLAVGSDYTASITARPRPGAPLEALMTPEPGAIVAEASSRAVSDPLGRPQAALDRDRGTGWVAGPDDETPTLTLTWDERRQVESFELIVEPWLAASRPSRVMVATGDDTYEVDVDADGHVTLPEPVRTAELTIQVLAVDEVVDTDAAFGLQSVLPVGVSELVVDGADDLRRPVDETAPVELACGSGPELTVGDELVPTELAATVGDLLHGRRLEARPCGGESVTLAPGRTDVVVEASPTARVEALTLRPSEREAATAADRAAVDGRADLSADVSVRTWDATRREVAVSERDEPVVLAVTENANSGWQATLDGRPLRSVRLDGWSQGYVLPPGDAGVVRLAYAPDMPYRVALGAGVLGVVAVGGACLLAPAGPALLHRGRPRKPGARIKHRRPGVGPVALLGVVALVLVGGITGLAAVAFGVAIAAAGRRWEPVGRALPYVAALTVALAGIVVAVTPWPGPDPGAHAGAAQALMLLGLATATIGTTVSRYERSGISRLE